MPIQNEQPWFYFSLDLCTPEPELVEDEKQLINEIKNLELEHAY